MNKLGSDTVKNEPYRPAPEIQAQVWLNTKEPLALKNFVGKVVVIHGFQMLCPGCTLHGIPQAIAIEKLFQNADVQVIGLHSVFEHHTVMTVEALKAYVHEYNIHFPVAVDAPSTSAVPKTMASYGMRGTPSLILLDKKGRIRLHHFGRMDDMRVGSMIAGLLSERDDSLTDAAHSSSDANGCGTNGCVV